MATETVPGAEDQPALRNASDALLGALKIMAPCRR